MYFLQLIRLAVGCIQPKMTPKYFKAICFEENHSNLNKALVLKMVYLHLQLPGLPLAFEGMTQSLVKSITGNAYESLLIVLIYLHCFPLSESKNIVMIRLLGSLMFYSSLFCNSLRNSYHI